MQYHYASAGHLQAARVNNATLKSREGLFLRFDPGTSVPSSLRENSRLARFLYCPPPGGHIGIKHMPA